MTEENIKQISEMTEEEILKEACEYLCAACELLFELDSDRGIASAFMADCALKYTQDTLKDRDPRLSDDYHYKKKLEEKK